MSATESERQPARAGEGDRPEELADGAFRAIASLYASACLLASIVFITSGNNFLFTYMHLAFVGAVGCMFLARDFANGLWRPLVRNWSAAFLILFIVYFVTITLVYHDGEIARSYQYAFMTTMMPGLLMGYVAFAAYGRPRAIARMWRGRWSPTFQRKLVDLTALAVYAGVLGLAFWLFAPHMRKDIFIINVPPEQRIYQLFGNYLALALFLALHVLAPYFDHRYRRTIIASIVWAVFAGAAAVASFILAQAIGSNTGAAMVLVMGLALAGHRMWKDLRTRTGGGYRRSFAILAVVIAWAICLQLIFDTLPPMRLFGYR